MSTTAEWGARLHEEYGDTKRITNDQYREYLSLKRSRDNLVSSLRTQMTIQNQEALSLARAVVSAMVGDTKLGAAIVNNQAAAEALERAQILLLTE